MARCRAVWRRVALVSATRLGLEHPGRVSWLARQLPFSLAAVLGLAIGDMCCFVRSSCRGNEQSRRLSRRVLQTQDANDVSVLVADAGLQMVAELF